MAVTTQESTEYENVFTDEPPNPNNTTEWHGRQRIAFFTHNQSGAGDATSSVALVKLPPGRVRLLLGESLAYVNWTTASATLDLGWDAYTDLDGTAVAADPNGLIDGLDVDTAGVYSGEDLVTSLTNTVGGTKVFESKDGVVIRATTQDVAIVDDDDLVGYFTYVVD